MKALPILLLCLLWIQDPVRLPPLPLEEVPGAEPSSKPDEGPAAGATSRRSTDPLSESGSGDPTRASTRPTTRALDPKALLRRDLRGVWRVSAATQVGRGPGRSPAGYLVITRSHLSFHMTLDRASQSPMFQSGMRTYVVDGNQLVMSSLMGHRTGEKPGHILVDPVGHREVRRFALLAPNHLRLTQPGGQTLEFTKVEGY